MTALQGTIKNGQIILDAQPRCPKHPRGGAANRGGPTHARHARGRLADDTEGIAALVARHGPGRTGVARAGR